MAAMTEVKRQALIQLLGREMADRVIAQAEQTEKQATERGIAYKERKQAAAPFSGAPQYLDNPANGIGAFVRGGM